MERSGYWLLLADAGMNVEPDGAAWLLSGGWWANSTSV